MKRSDYPHFKIRIYSKNIFFKRNGTFFYIYIIYIIYIYVQQLKKVLSFKLN